MREIVDNKEDTLKLPIIIMRLHINSFFYLIISTENSICGENANFWAHFGQRYIKVRNTRRIECHAEFTTIPSSIAYCCPIFQIQSKINMFLSKA